VAKALDAEAAQFAKPRDCNFYPMIPPAIDARDFHPTENLCLTENLRLRRYHPRERSCSER
jgi:hypothetical protein